MALMAGRPPHPRCRRAGSHLEQCLTANLACASDPEITISKSNLDIARCEYLVGGTEGRSCRWVQDVGSAISLHSGRAFALLDGTHQGMCVFRKSHNRRTLYLANCAAVRLPLGGSSTLPPVSYRNWLGPGSVNIYIVKPQVAGGVSPFRGVMEAGADGRMRDRRKGLHVLSSENVINATLDESEVGSGQPSRRIVRCNQNQVG